MRAVFGGNVERAAELVARVDAAEAVLGIRPTASGFGTAVLPFFRGDLETARIRGGDWVERARASGDPYELGTALALYGAALQPSDPDGSMAAHEEVVRIGREAGIASVLSIGLSAVAAVPHRFARRRTTRWRSSTKRQVGTDRRRTVVTARSAARPPSRPGRWSDALSAVADVADDMLHLGLVWLPVTFRCSQRLRR
jgi:hypothetical protein